MLNRFFLVIGIEIILLVLTGCNFNSDAIVSNSTDPPPYQVYKPGGNIPLNDPEIFTYNGLVSGLYSWGNVLNASAYSTKYINTCKRLRPLNAQGITDQNGSIVLVAIGGSNPAIVFNGIQHAEDADVAFTHHFNLINAGINAMDFSDLLNDNGLAWQNIDHVVDSLHFTNLQVQIVFCIEDDLKNLDTTFDRVYALENEYTRFLNRLREQYPNCKLLYVGDRGYSGYCTLPQHKEPIGYLNGWAVKLFVQDYTSHKLNQYPIVNWLDYYWADGTTPRWDGLTYTEDDFRGSENLHFTVEKGDELGRLTHNRLKSEAGSKYWYK